MIRDLSYQQLLDFGRAAADFTLQTVTGREFTVGIYRDGLFFTPISTGNGQSDGRKAHERFIERYNATGSTRPGDYADVTRNASYLLGLLHWAESR
ncbi:MAG: hypothetical protein ACJ769_12825 [Chloroflexota bacterium]